MVIFQSCASKSWGGLEMQTLKISAALQKRGHEVFVLCPIDSRLEQESTHFNVNAQPIYRGESRFLSDIRRIQALIKSCKTDIIHTHLSHDLWFLVPAMDFTRSSAKLYLTKRMASGVRKKDPLHRYLYNRLEHVYAISNYIRQSVLNTCPVSEEIVRLLPNAIDLETFRADRYDRDDARAQLVIAKEALVIGFVGRITPGKGHMEFIKAVSRIAKPAQPVTILFVGEPSYGEEEYAKEITAMALQQLEGYQVIFTGYRRDIPRMLRAMDIFAFPSHEESFGTILVEAMAMELPVVACRSGGVPDIVVDGDTGILVPPRTVDELSDALLTLIADDELRRRLGRNGRRHVERHFDFAKYIDTLEEDYRAPSRRK